MCNLFHKNWKHLPSCACAVLSCVCNPCLKWFIIFRARAFYFYMQLSTVVVAMSSLNVWTWINYIFPMQSFGWVEGHPASNASRTVLLPPQRLRLFPNPCGGYVAKRHVSLEVWWMSIIWTCVLTFPQRPLIVSPMLAVEKEYIKLCPPLLVLLIFNFEDFNA